MTKQEYLRKIDNMGLCREMAFELVPQNIEEVLDFDILWDETILALKKEGYINKCITKQVICLDKVLVFDYMKEKCKLQDYELEDAWRTLKQDFGILNEFKYHVFKGEFIPKGSSICFNGYTVEQIYNETDLSLLASFNMMIFLKQNPSKALGNIKGWKKGDLRNEN